MRRVSSRVIGAVCTRPVRDSPIAIRTAFPAYKSQTTTARQLHGSARVFGPLTAAALPSTRESYPTSHDKIESIQDTPYFIDNEFKFSETTQYIDLTDPATGNLITRVPQSTDAELKAAVASAKKAWPAWRDTSIMARQQIMFKFTQLVRDNWDRLAASITLEQGKTFADAKGDVLRGLQVAEQSCGIPEAMKGELLEVAKDMETRSYRLPLGIVAAICPFSEYEPGTQSILLTDQK